MLEDPEISGGENFKSGYVAIIGKPNAGKSSILNFFLKEKISIVSEKPQTTRENILGIMNQPDCQIIFVDTPGMHRPTNKFGKFMFDEALSAPQDVDVLLIVLDAFAGITAEDRMIFSLPQIAANPHNYKWKAVLINKIDQVAKPDLLPLMRSCSALISADEYIPVSAKTGENLDLVLSRVKEKLSFGPMYYPGDQLTDKNERFLVGELIREQVLKFCREEVPHAVAVKVESFKDDPGRKTHITATIYVENDSQKKIIIGKDGQMLKKIGISARAQAEQFLQRGVFMELWVKTRKNWRKDDKFLRELGYVNF